MEIFANIYTIAALIAVSIGLLLYAFMVPRNLENFELNINSKNKDASLLRLLSNVGNEIYSTLPAHRKKNQLNPRLEALLVKAGNPWDLTVEEFQFMQFVTAFLGLVGGSAISFLFMVLGIKQIPWWAVPIFFTVLGFCIPRLRYNEEAKQRDLDFKRQLPEALDLITISLSGNNTFTYALKESIPNMRDGVLKEEFKKIVRNIDTGRTITESLDLFGERAPNENVKTFVQAVKEGIELNVPLVEILKSQAEASRQELFAYINNKTAQLNSKMMAVLTPTLIPALMIILLAPSLASLITLL